MNDPDSKPIVQHTEPDRATLRRTNPISGGDTATVYRSKSGVYRLATRRLTASEIWLDTPTVMYTVDTAAHPESFEIDLPSAEEAFSFHAKVDVCWRVADPLQAVQSSLSEPERVYRPHLEGRLREITRQFDVESSAAAERQIYLTYGDRIVELAQGLSLTRCSAILSLDQGTRQHIAGRTHAKRQAERRGQEHTAKLEKLHLTELEGSVEQRLALQRAEHEQKLEKLAEEHALEMKQQRMMVYADALRTDNLNVLALRLAGHGDDVNDVINLMMQQRKLEYDSANAVLNSLLEANLVNRKDVAAIMAKASNVITDNFRGVTPLGIGAADRLAQVGPTKPDSAPQVHAERLEEPEDDDDD